MIRDSINHSTNDFLKKCAKQFLTDNYNIKDEWKKLNSSFFEILNAEKRLRRNILFKKIINNETVKLADELDDILSRSSDSFYAFQSDKIMQFKEKQFNLINSIVKKIKSGNDDVINYFNFLFEKLPKTKNSFLKCVKKFTNLFSDITELNFNDFMQRISESDFDANWQMDNISFFKSTYSALEQLIIEYNSKENYRKIEELKKTIDELKNSTLTDFLLNFLDRNTTIFQLAKINLNSDNLVEVIKEDFIYVQYCDFFPSPKLISEVRNFLEHRSNSYNVDISVFSSTLIFFLTNNIFMMIISTLLYIKKELNFDDLVN